MPDLTTVSIVDRNHLAQAIRHARKSREAGNHPFGAILVTEDGAVLKAQNTVVTHSDPTGHAETNLVRLAGVHFSREELRLSTLYASTEPCPMCSGAIHWAGIGRVVYALPEQTLRQMVPAHTGVPTMDLPCREIFARGGDTVTVAGPALLSEATNVHAGFWDAER